MGKMINKKLGMIVGAVSLLIIMLSLINAFGVTLPFWDENPLKLAPGESTTISLGLQNMVGSENVTLKAELTSDGSGVASLVDENLEYFVPLGGGTDVPLKIEVPENAVGGYIYNIIVSFTQVSSGEGGMVHVAGGFTSKISAQVVGEEESELYSPPAPKEGISGFWFLIIVIAIAVILIIFAAARKKKTKKSR